MNGAALLPQQDYEFVAAIRHRPVVLTYVLLGANLFVFVLMTLSGGTNNIHTLAAYGAKLNTAIDQGELWRLVTPVFIHMGWLHILSNAYAIWTIGSLVEKIYGGARFAILYLLAGVGGVVASYHFNPEAVSAGASGAIFGLFGVMLIFALRHKNSIPAFYYKAVIRTALLVIVITLVLSFTPIVAEAIPPDNAAHLGGLITGGLLAAVIPFQRPGSLPGAASKAVQVVALLLVAISFFQVYRHYNGPRLSSRVSLSLNPIAQSATPEGDFVNALNSAQDAFNGSIAALAARNVPGVAKASKETAKALDQLRAVPSLANSSDDLIDELLTLMRDQYTLEQAVGREQAVTFSHEMRGKENTRRFKEIDRKFKDWVKSEGHDYGIGLPQPE